MSDKRTKRRRLNIDGVRDVRTNPFAMVTKCVIDDETFIKRGSDKLVYTVICSFADNESKDAFPSVKTIAKRACCSEHTVRRSVKRLQELELIRVETRYSDVGRQTSNKYVLVDPPARFKGG
ncbi:helix-turn-helix domain-containing protein [Salibacterium lacus]|uniref:Helix-turn-helix domain-containing protein n=1 Tax=Salibacterium lacus TaxID=1898109 RepID=A0ABW5SY77_9BACI